MSSSTWKTVGTRDGDDLELGLLLEAQVCIRHEVVLAAADLRIVTKIGKTVRDFSRLGQNSILTRSGGSDVVFGPIALSIVDSFFNRWA